MTYIAFIRRRALMLSSSHKPGCMAAIPASQSCRVRRVLCMAAAHSSCVQPTAARRALMDSGEGFDERTNVFFQLSPTGSARGWRIVRRRVASIRHGMLFVLCADAFRRVDNGAFTTLGQGEAGLNMVYFNAPGCVDVDGHCGLSGCEVEDIGEQVDTLLSGHVQSALCVVDQVGLFAAVQVAGAGAQHEVGLECVNSALLSPDFGTALAGKIGDVDADLAGGWVGPSAECCHGVCSVWNASYRLDSGGSWFAAMTVLYTRIPCVQLPFVGKFEIV